MREIVHRLFCNLLTIMMIRNAQTRREVRTIFWDSFCSTNSHTTPLAHSSTSLHSASPYEIVSCTTNASRIFSTPLFPPNRLTSSLACCVSLLSTSLVYANELVVSSIYETAYVFGEGDSGRSRKMSTRMSAGKRGRKGRRTEDSSIRRVGSNGMNDGEGEFTLCEIFAVSFVVCVLYRRSESS